MTPRVRLILFILTLASVVALPQSLDYLYDRLPLDFCTITVEKTGEGALADGYYFCGPYGESYRTPYYNMIFDERGVPLYYREACVYNFRWHAKTNRFSFFTITHTPDLPRRHFVELDSTFALRRSFLYKGDLWDYHEAVYKPNGNVLMFMREEIERDMSAVVPGGDTAAIIEDVPILEIDDANNVVWRWDPIERVQLTESDVDLTQHRLDYIHSNSIEFDDDGGYLVSHRNFNQIMKIDPESGDVIWRFGGALNDFTIVGDTLGFSRQHMIRRTPWGTYTIFDNGWFHSPQFSRGLEYALDETTMTATLLREYRAAPDLFTFAMGSMQPLANGNMLLGFSFEREGIEFDSTGAELLRVRFDHDGSRFYRMFKFPWRNTIFGVERDTLRFDSDGDEDTIRIVNTYNHTVPVNAFLSETGRFDVVGGYPAPLVPGAEASVVVRYNRGSELRGSEYGYLCSYTDSIGFAQDFVILVEDTAVSATSTNQETPDEFLVAGAYPNPFNGVATVEYRLAAPADVEIEIYSALGERTTVGALEAPRRRQAGTHRERFSFEERAAGVYFITIHARPLEGAMNGESFQKIVKVCYVK